MRHPFANEIKPSVISYLKSVSLFDWSEHIDIDGETYYSFSHPSDISIMAYSASSHKMARIEIEGLIFSDNESYGQIHYLCQSIENSVNDRKAKDIIEKIKNAFGI